MATITGLNMIKSVFAALGAKTSDSNYAVPLLNKTTAEPKGYMDMASLASVLGDISLGRESITVPANSSVPFPSDLANKVFLAYNPKTSTALSVFFKPGGGNQIVRVAGQSVGLSVGDESEAALHISVVDDVLTITNNRSSIGEFRYRPLL